MPVSIIIENSFVQKWPSLQIADVVPPSWFVIEHCKVENCAEHQAFLSLRRLIRFADCS
jgi:hypothetical protein